MLKIMTLQMFITAKYPGGFEKFIKDKGCLCYIPPPADLIYVVHPNLPKDIKTALTRKYKKGVIFGDKWNFEGATEQDYQNISESVSEVLNMLDLGIVGSVSNPCVFCISLPQLKKDDPRVNILVERFATMPGVVRGCVLVSDGHLLFDGVVPPPSTTKDIPKVISIGGDRPKRETVINQDDINNLIIALETCRDLPTFLTQV